MAELPTAKIRQRVLTFQIYFLPYRVDFHSFVEIVDDFEHLPRLSVSAPAHGSVRFTGRLEHVVRALALREVAHLALIQHRSRPLAGRLLVHEVPLTARESRHIDHTLQVLEYIGMPFNQWIFELGAGPRVVVNDIKPPGVAGNKRALKTAYGINLDRDEGITSSHRTIAAKI